MKQHILIEKAYSYPNPVMIENPQNCTYEITKGYWSVDSSNKPMVLSEEGKMLGTKKCDRETGEDQKGE